jgi:hypothetical protein
LSLLDSTTSMFFPWWSLLIRRVIRGVHDTVLQEVVLSEARNAHVCCELYFKLSLVELSEQDARRGCSRG